MSNLYYGGGFKERPRRGFPVGTILAGFGGVILGALLVYYLFTVLVLPGWEKSGLPPAAPAPAPADPGPPVINADLETPVVVAVEKASPVVVGVTNYVHTTRFGQRVLFERGSGSGVIISADGYIVTNQHVIDGAQVIEVALSNGRILQAALQGEDFWTDLALLKIEEKNLPYLVPGDSARVRVGETAIAIGNPLKYFKRTVTSGVISAVERQVDFVESNYSYTYLQTDAAINAGNSGGPLINLRGEIIGINSAKIKEVGVEGIGFAIPSNTVRRVVDDLKQFGRFKRPYLGIKVIDLSRQTGIASDQGIFVAEVEEEGPAAAGGLRAEDVIIAVGENSVDYSARLNDTLLDYYPGDTVTLTVDRDESPISLEIVLGEMPTS